MAVYSLNRLWALMRLCRLCNATLENTKWQDREDGDCFLHRRSDGSQSQLQQEIEQKYWFYHMYLKIWLKPKIRLTGNFAQQQKSFGRKMAVWNCLSAGQSTEPCWDNRAMEIVGAGGKWQLPSVLGRGPSRFLRIGAVASHQNHETQIRICTWFCHFDYTRSLDSDRCASNRWLSMLPISCPDKLSLRSCA